MKCRIPEKRRNLLPVLSTPLIISSLMDEESSCHFVRTHVGRIRETNIVPSTSKVNIVEHES